MVTTTEREWEVEVWNKKGKRSSTSGEERGSYTGWMVRIYVAVGVFFNSVKSLIPRQFTTTLIIIITQGVSLSLRRNPSLHALHNLLSLAM